MTISKNTNHAALKAALEAAEARRRPAPVVVDDDLQVKYRTVTHRIRYATSGGYAYREYEEHIIEN